MGRGQIPPLHDFFFGSDLKHHIWKHSSQRSARPSFQFQDQEGSVSKDENEIETEELWSQVTRPIPRPEFLVSANDTDTEKSSSQLEIGETSLQFRY